MADMGVRVGLRFPAVSAHSSPFLHPGQRIAVVVHDEVFAIVFVELVSCQGPQRVILHVQARPIDVRVVRVEDDGMRPMKGVKRAI